METKRNLEWPVMQAHEVLVREGNSIQTKDGKKKALLLYQDARAAMNRLDNQFGEYGWQREHKDVHGNTYCGVSLWSEEHKCWVTKWDAGEPGAVSKIKAEASDSFKRACVNWGIGRELYTAPKIYVDEDVNTQRLKVTRIDYDKDRKICDLEICDYYGNVIYTYEPKKRATGQKSGNGGVIYPNTKKVQAMPAMPAAGIATKAPTTAEAKRPRTALEQQEFESAMAAMDFAESREMVNSIYQRYASSIFADELLAHAHTVLEQHGWLLEQMNK